MGAGCTLVVIQPDLSTSMHKFETFNTPIRVKLNIPVDVATFGGISLIAAELNQVESQRKRVDIPLRTDFKKQRGYRLVSFEVHSPPQASVLADPSWLAVYISLLALGVSCLQLVGSYSSVKREAQVIATDIGRLKTFSIQQASEIAEALSALSEAQRRDLLLGAQLYIDAFTSTIDSAQKTILRATRFASILGRRNNKPELDVRIEPTIIEKDD